MLITMFFKSTNASGAFIGILSASSGFVIGAYIPISEFSGTIQTICNIFPAVVAVFCLDFFDTSVLFTELKKKKEFSFCQQFRLFLFSDLI